LAIQAADRQNCLLSLAIERLAHNGTSTKEIREFKNCMQTADVFKPICRAEFVAPYCVDTAQVELLSINDQRVRIYYRRLTRKFRRRCVQRCKRKNATCHCDRD
jgi:hypothetical protein